MNVVLLSDHYREGGAAVATSRVAESLLTEPRPLGSGKSVHRVVHFADGDVSVSMTLWYEESALQRALYRVPRKVLPAFFPRPNTSAFSGRRLRAVLQRLKPEVINVHNLHTATLWGWGPHLIEVCLEFAPVVWTLHDMWAFTGRCAYSYDCEKFITGCDATCPTPHEEPKLAPEKICAAWEERQGIYARHRDDLIVVTPSRWLADQARRGLFANHRIEVIPYGVNVPTLIARDDARRQLGIDADGPVLLLAAFDLTERRKGAAILPQLWRHVQHRPVTILTMGHGMIAIDEPGIKVHALGWLEDDAKKSLAYAAADALLHPAPVDNFPNVVLEAMAHGTPTIALPVGGVPELVRPTVTGWLADAATPEALGRAVDQALGDLSIGKNMHSACRTILEAEYSLELQGRRYRQLFEERTRAASMHALPAALP